MGEPMLMSGGGRQMPLPSAAGAAAQTCRASPNYSARFLNSLLPGPLLLDLCDGSAEPLLDGLFQSLLVIPLVERPHGLSGFVERDVMAGHTLVAAGGWHEL